MHDMQSLDVKEEVNEQEQEAEEVPATPSPSVTPSEHNEHDIDQVDANVDGGYEHEFYDSEPQHQQTFYRKQQQNMQHYNKRQTGKKNISNIVVGLNDKIEFDQIDDKGFGVVKINRPIGVRSRSSTHEHLNDNESTCSHDSERTHTADGYFDLKFYSHPLW